MTKPTKPQKGKQNQRPPSLLEPQARGGDVAVTGFSFQESVLMARLPLWLSYVGFSEMIREAIGDTEAKFYVPGQGYVRELLEAKNHEVSNTEFWEEIARFQNLDRASPGTFRWFTLACTGIAPDLRVLSNGLRRIRSPFHFYESDTGIFQNSFRDYLDVVTKFGKNEECARFLFEKVLIESELAMAQSYGDTLFYNSLSKHFARFGTLSPTLLKHVYDELKLLVQSRLNTPISRLELDAKMFGAIPSQDRPHSDPIGLFTAIDTQHDDSSHDLRFEWADFWGGDARQYPPATVWNNKLLVDLGQTRDWIKVNYNNRVLRLSGDRRLSAIMAIGATFSAVAGFTVDVNYRGLDWSTGAHSEADTPDYPLKFVLPSGIGQDLVVTIGIYRKITPEVQLDLETHGLGKSPILEIQGDQPILSDMQANKVAALIKDKIAEALVRSGGKQVHLFYAGPSHLALFLGHRLNATAPVQCYERVSVGHYVPTVRLFGSIQHP